MRGRGWGGFYSLIPRGVGKNLRSPVETLWSGLVGLYSEPQKLEHGFRMISAGIPYTLPLRP